MINLGGIMPEFTNSSDKVGSDKEPLLSQDAETEESLYGNRTPIYTNSHPETSVIDPDRSVTHDGNDNLDKNKEYVLYLERWYVLSIFTLLGFASNCVWNTWGPIQDTASAVLQWDQGQFALLANWGSITFITSAFFFSWFLHVKGLRVSVLFAGGLLVFGVGVRCIPVSVDMMKWTMHIGHIFIGLSGPVLLGANTMLSAVWFPSNERTTATAISSIGIPLGMAASFLIGPGIVGNINVSSTPTPLITQDGNSSQYYLDDEMEKGLEQIRLLMYVEFGATALMYLAALIRFPDKPKTPPTASAVAKREDMIAGLKALVKKSSFWIPALASGIPGGVSVGWNAQFFIIFQDKLDETTSGWIGFVTNIVALSGAMIVGRFADYFTGKMKAILILLNVANCVATLWTILLLYEYIPFNPGSLYASIVLSGLFAGGCIPIFMEITVEGSFPIGEETVTIVMTWLSNVFCMCFLILPMIPALDENLGWLNWVLLGSTVAIIPLLCIYKEQYHRLDFDTGPTTEERNDPEHLQITPQPA